MFRQRSLLDKRFRAVTLSEAKGLVVRLRVNHALGEANVSAEGLVRPMTRFFAALRMTVYAVCQFVQQAHKAVFFAVWLAAAGIAQSDTVVLNNGASFEGVVVREDEREIVIRMAYGTMSFAKKEVKAVTRSSQERNDGLSKSWGQEQERLKREQEERRRADEAQRAKGLVKFDGEWVTEEEAARRVAQRSRSRGGPSAPSGDRDTPAAIAAGAGSRSPLGADLLKEGTWAHQSTAHFVVFFQEGDTGKAVANKAEYYLEKIRYDLNMPREVKWSEPCEVFVVKDAQLWKERVVSTTSSDLAVGVSSVAHREIYVKGVDERQAATVFAHELSHLVVAEFADRRSAPLWLQEGLAVYESGGLTGQARALRDAQTAGRLLPLGDLHDTYRGKYPIAQADLILFYLEASSLVEFMITRFGREKFGTFAGELIKSSDLTRAVRTAFGERYSRSKDLYDDWVRSLQK